jgi:hypothetical protein
MSSAGPTSVAYLTPDLNQTKREQSRIFSSSSIHASTTPAGGFSSSSFSSSPYIPSTSDPKQQVTELLKKYSSDSVSIQQHPASLTSSTLPSGKKTVKSKTSPPVEEVSSFFHGSMSPDSLNDSAPLVLPIPVLPISTSSIMNEDPALLHEIDRLSNRVKSQLNFSLSAESSSK